MRFRSYRGRDRTHDEAVEAPGRSAAAGPARAVTTLVSAGAAGLLVYLATRVGEGTNGGYWSVYGLIAAAGLVMALAQLLGGWTKWGMPRLSGSVFLLAFLPVLVVTGWVLAAGQPDPNWARDHVLAWSSDIHVRTLVSHLREYAAVLGFGVGLVLGYSFDTTGPRRVRAASPAATDVARDDLAADEPTAAERRETVVSRRSETVDEAEADEAPASPRRRFLSRR